MYVCFCVISGLICRYEIISYRNNIPFTIEVKNRETGEGILKLKDGEHLNYGKRKHYKFNIFAYDCVEPQQYAQKSKRLERHLFLKIYL